MKPWVLPLLACPRCRGTLNSEGPAGAGPLTCGSCAVSYEVTPTAAVFSRTDGDERLPQPFLTQEESFLPHHGGRVFAQQYAIALRDALAGQTLAGSVVLNVCCRGGAEAEALTQAGARVLALDPSRTALAAAQRRAKLLGFYWEHLHADPEALPLKDRAVDFALLRDSLTRLRPVETALAEITRVAKTGLFILDRLFANAAGLHSAESLSAWLKDRGWSVRVHRRLDLTPLPPPEGMRGFQHPLTVRPALALLNLGRFMFDRRGRYGILVAIRQGT